MERHCWRRYTGGQIFLSIRSVASLAGHAGRYAWGLRGRIEGAYTAAQIACVTRHVGRYGAYVDVVVGAYTESQIACVACLHAVNNDSSASLAAAAASLRRVTMPYEPLFVVHGTRARISRASQP